jgi:hypothetical protein
MTNTPAPTDGRDTDEIGASGGHRDPAVPPAAGGSMKIEKPDLHPRIANNQPVA